MFKWIGKHKLPVFIIIAAAAAMVFLGMVSASKDGGPFERLSGTVLGKIGEPFAFVGKKISTGVSGIFLYGDIADENDELRAENEELKRKLAEAEMAEAELAELRRMEDAVGLVKDRDKDIVSARIISMDGTNWMNLFTINAGKESGIKKGDIVVYGNGFVGTVKTVGSGWSKVGSILDESMNVSFMVSGKSSVMGVLDGTEDNRLTGFLVDSEADIKEGDELVTSGLGTYPGGISIGKVTEINVDEDRKMTNIVVEPTVDFGAIRKVSVIV